MRILIVLISVLILISCETNPAKQFTSVSIERIFTDSLSIRALAPMSNDKVWFAANHGRVGLIDGTIPKLATIKYDESFLNFRAIALTNEAVFVLSIENPGVLYKIGYNKDAATNIEEVYVEKGKKVFYDAIAFWNNTEGIAIGDPTEDCLSIIITRDGGNNWEKLSCDVLPKIVQGEAVFAASNSNISVFKNHVWIATGGKKARVFHSSDKGESWEVFDTPIIQGKTMTGIYSIDFFDSRTGIIFGGDWSNQDFNEGNKAITTDGGKTWSLVSNGQGPGYRSSVKFTPGSRGRGVMAVGSKGISYSNDQGESWIELSEEGFYAIAFVNDTLAFASGRNKIAKLIFKE